MSAVPYAQLEQEWKRLHALRGALALLRWDAAVMMPRGSADIRGEQLAALETEYHNMLTAPRIIRLLERAAANASGLDEWQLANLREMRRERDHAIATPASLVARLAKATSRAESQWLAARQEGRFEILSPHLDEVLHLVRDKAALLGQATGLAPYDALLDEFSPGLTTTEVDDLFKAYSRRLPTLIREAIALQGTRPILPMAGKFSPGRQRALITEVMKAMGFAFERGRLDESDHAFTEGVPGDVRITTRLAANEPFSGLLGALHELGHAIYGIGLPSAWAGQPVGRDCGMAIEESQSLLLEMIIVRSRPFVHYLRPLLEKHFAVSGPEWEPENIFRHLVRVQRGLIRVDADELTYNAHIMMRYDLEKQLLGGELAVRHLPDAWNAAMDARLGVKPANDNEGCMQDIHWALGSFGYFPSYSVGAAAAAQFMESLRRDVPTLDTQIAAGDFSGLFGWLRERVHKLGSKQPTPRLVREATGKPVSAQSALRYLETKYLEGAEGRSSAAA